MAKPARKIQGFTLIELIIVVIVISLGLFVAIPLYNNFTSQKLLEKEAFKLSDALTVARNMSSSPQACGVNQEFQGYRLAFTSNNYTVYQCCGTSGQPPACSSTFRSYKINAANVQITDPPNFVHFLPLSAGIYTGSDADLELKNTVKDECIKILIDNSGRIYFDTPYPYSC